MGRSPRRSSGGVGEAMRAITEQAELERRAKIAEASRQRWQDSEYKARVSAKLRAPRPKQQGRPSWNKEVSWSPETKLKMSESAKRRGKIPEAYTPEVIAKRTKTIRERGSLKKKWQEPGFRDKLLHHLQELNQSPEHRLTCIKGGRTCQQKHPEVILKLVAAAAEYVHSPEGRAVLSKRTKQQWSRMGSDLIKAQRRGMKQPNKKEIQLQIILDTHFPDQWEYVGNGQVVLANLVPDFINKNGKKAVIELFGDYWHGEQRLLRWYSTELGRIMGYNSLGFKCLIIWEKELKNEHTIISKIKHFTKTMNSHHR